MAFTILTLNVHGLRDRQKQDYVASLLHNYGADCILLQETHFTCLRDAQAFTARHKLQGAWSFGTSHSCGVGIVLSACTAVRLEKFQCDVFGRVVSADITVANRRLRLVCVYAPNDAKDRYSLFNNLDAHMLTPNEIIFGGDFNCVLDPSLDKQGGDPRSGSKGTESLIQLLSDCSLIDSWRSLRGNTFEPTWRGRGVLCRLDRLYVSTSLVDNLRNIDVVPVGSQAQYVSDHSAVKLTLQGLSTVERGPGLWKLNVSLLQIREIRQSVETLLGQLCQSSVEKTARWWEDVKFQVTSLLREAGRSQAKEKRDELWLLNRKLLLLVDGARHHADPETTNAIERLKKSISEHQMAKFRQFRVKSHCEYLEREAQHSRAFYRDHKERGTSGVLDILRSDDGSEITESGGLIDAFVEHFTEVFKDKAVDRSEWDHLFRDLPVISPIHENMLEGEVTCEELDRAVRSQKAGKTPGQDGLPAEFYKMFWNILGPSFTLMVNNCFESGVFPSTLSTGVISLLCKDEARRDRIAAWRPITLLNTDFKIIARVLAVRMSEVVGEVVDPSQTCAVPGRSVHDNLLTLRDVLTYVEQKDIPACVLSLDQRMAFDCLDRGFMLGTLEAFGFGPRMCSRISLLYTGTSSCVMLNGIQSVPFSLRRGIRQGCPMSPVLYVLCMETLANRLRKNSLIKGIPLPGRYVEQYSECLHADDVSQVLTDESSVTETLREFGSYGRASGSEVNPAKSQLKWVGAWRHRTDSVYNIPVQREGIKILGVTFGNTKDVQGNWKVVGKRLVDEAEKWKRSGASFSAKATIIRQVLLPLLWFLSMVFPPSWETISEIERVCFRFLWHPRKTESVSRARIRLPPDKGGWGIPDIQNHVLGQVVARTVKVLSQPERKGYFVARYLLGSYAHHVKGECSSGIFPKSAVTPRYYRTILSTVMRLQRTNPGIRVEDLKATDIETLLSPALGPPPRTRCRARVIDWSSTWTHVCNKNIEPLRRDLSWRIAHGALPVRQILVSHGIGRIARCPCCDQSESLEHAFHGCLNAAGVWRAVSGLFGIPRVEASTVLYFDPMPVANELVDQFVLLASEAKYQLWLARNTALYEGKRLGLTEVVRNVRSMLTFRLQCEFKRLGLDGFKRKWASPATICLASRHGVDVVF